jgi:hypothetical protein
MLTVNRRGVCSAERREVTAGGDGVDDDMWRWGLMGAPAPDPTGRHGVGFVRERVDGVDVRT